MTLENEIEVYNKAKASADAGEIETWDRVIFPNIIRKREIGLILSQAKEVKPKRVLDFGCGAGWLSRVLSSNGYNVVGIDASSFLIKTANKKPSQLSHFAIGDCINLPFKDGVFDFIVGVAVLHHLDPDAALAECWRVSTPNATLICMEPNKLNPVATLGRMVTNIQTIGEKPFYTGDLRDTLIRQGWAITTIRYLFPYSFGLAYLLKKLRGTKQGLKNICVPIEASEKFVEKIPYLNRLCWMIFVVAKKPYPIR